MIQSAEFLSIELQGKILVELKTNLARFYLFNFVVVYTVYCTSASCFNQSDLNASDITIMTSQLIYFPGGLEHTIR